MILYIVEANFYDNESSWKNLLSIRYDKQEAEDDKKAYEEIQSNNKKLAEIDYGKLSNKFNLADEGEWTQELNQKMCECEKIVYDDFIDVSITEVELDKALYSKEDITYVSAL